MVVDGKVNEWYLLYYVSIVCGGVGLVIVEVIVVVLEGCIMLGCIGIWLDELV